MSYVTDSQLATIADLSTGLPATELRPGDWVVVAQVYLPAGTKLSWKWVFLQMYSTTGTGPVLANLTSGTGSGGSSQGVAFAMLTDAYTGSLPVSFISSSSSGWVSGVGRLDLPNSLSAPASPVQILPAAAVSLTVPSGGRNYTVLVANNTTGNNVKLSLAGQLRVTQA